jgi:integrase
VWLRASDLGHRKSEGWVNLTSAPTGMPLNVLQQNLGHVSLNTTTIYATSEDRRLMKAVNQFWAKQGAW